MVDVNLIPKEYREKRQKLLIAFSKTGGVVLVLFILSLLLYGGLLLYQQNLDKKIDNIKQETFNLNQKRDSEMEQAIVELDKKLGVLKDLFKKHLYWSKIFNKIEELVISEVYFSTAQLSLGEEDLSVVFAGNALTYTSLARQVLSFQEYSLVKEVKVSNISLANEGGINFNFSATFSKDVLLNK